MAFLKRLSDSFWSYVSPTKTDDNNANHAALFPTPNSERPFKKPALPAHRRASMYDLSKNARSMSPGERIGNWQARSPVSISAGAKRKRDSVLSPSIGRKGKMSKMDLDSNNGRADQKVEQDAHEMDEDVEEEHSEDEVEDSSMAYIPKTPRHQPRPSLFSDDDDDEEDGLMSAHTSLVVGEQEPTPKRRVATLPEEHRMHHVSTEELRAQGFDDDYITLVQKIAMRGHEPLLPAYMKFEYSFLPDGLFEGGDDAFIASVRREHFRAGKALEQLTELGGRVRDRIYMRSHVQPEQQVERQVKAYMKWAFEDAGIDLNTAIPILAIEAQPSGFDAAALRANATRKCQILANRYKDALRVKRSIELSSPTSRSSTSTIISYPLPTLYAIIASHAVVALMSYRPDVSNAEVVPIAMFDFKEVNYDVWNSFAMAILVCHVRNVQMRIAEETGLGELRPSFSSEKGLNLKFDDPDA